MNNFHKIFIAAALFGTTIPVFAVDKSHSFNSGWKFSLESDSTCIVPQFDDSKWRSLTLPHDWSIEHPFDKNISSGNDGGYLPTGIGWYRKTFNLDNINPENKYQLYIGGAYMDSDVYVNGLRAGGHPYGYSSYFVDITPYLKSGKNTVTIKVDNSAQKNCRWYSGSGLYRDIKLIETGPVHISNWGTYITTPELNTAEVEISIDNETSASKKINVSTEIAGNKKNTEIEIPANIKGYKIKETINVSDAKPWFPDSPNLYDADIVLSENGKVIDSHTQKIGFRTIEWNAENGFKLNGKNLLLNGGCIHHDNGILGAAAYKDAERRRVRLMKEAGFNAVRTSHNIPSEAFLDACDEYGLLVIDEPFDGWRDAKNDHDYHELFDNHWKEDIDAMLLRDRNHPSIFCWSIGNEVIERKKLEVVTTAHKLASRCRELDPTRPVTSALASWDSDWEIYDPLAAEHDIVGYNYMIHKSEGDHERVPSRVMMQTESYPNDAWSNYRKSADNPYIIGDFVWTAMDYIGESGIGRHYYEGEVEGEHFHRPLYPWHASHCGDIDLTGFRKPISHYRSMLWNKDGEHLYIAVKEPDRYIGKVKTTMWGTWPTYESWNWEGHEGKSIEVNVYSHYPKVRLYLDDEMIGEQPVDKMTAVFTLPYKAGTLKAEGLDQTGKAVETKTLATSGEPKAIRLTADTEQIKPDNESLSFITIELIDKDGRVVPVADNQLEVKIKGAGSLVGLGNADIKDEDPYFDAMHKAWKGRALAVVRSNGKKGSINIKVSSPDIASKTIKISSK